MEHMDCGKRLRKGGLHPSGGVAAGDNYQQRIALIPRMEGRFCGLRSRQSQVRCVKCEARDARGTRSASCLTLGMSRLAEGHLRQTKPNLGGLGYMGKNGRGVGRLRRAARCAKRTQFAARGRQGRDALAANALRRHYKRDRLCETKSEGSSQLSVVGCQQAPDGHAGNCKLRTANYSETPCGVTTNGGKRAKQSQSRGDGSSDKCL